MSSESSMQWRENNPEEYANYQQNWKASHKDYMKEYYQKNKAKWSTSQQEHLKLIQLMGGKCIRCGFSDVRALQIDHIHGNGHQDNASRKIGGVRLYRRIFQEVALGSTDYQLLCANCNWIKRYENNEHSYRINEDETAQSTSS